MEPDGNSCIGFDQVRSRNLPRYYFDVKNGHRLVDPAGVDCPSDDEAKRQGAAVAHQIAIDVPRSEARRVAVLNDERREIAVIPIGERHGSQQTGR
jgi:hypothetical protein